MKIIVTGGSGAVGRNVLDQLCDTEDLEIIAFDQKNKRTEKFYRRYSDRISVHFGDLANKDDIIPIAKAVDCVIHLAAIIPPLADQHPELAQKVNVQGTRNLIEALEQHSKEAFFLYASSVSVYGDRLFDPMIAVGDPLHPSEGDEYAKTKIAAEQVVQNSQLDWSIFRLSAIMGANNHKVSALMFHMPLATSLEITTPQDTARAFTHALRQRTELSRKIFNLGGGPHCRITYRQFLARSFQIFGLGELDFPDRAFADHHFHCGFYADGDDLETILRFRLDTIESYFHQVEQSVPLVQKFATSPFRWIIKKRLLLQSDPWKAYRSNDLDMLTRYFNQVP